MIGLSRVFAAGTAPLLAIALVACSGGGNAHSGEFVIGGECAMPAGPLAVAISRRANSPGDLPVPVSQIVQRFITRIPAGVTGPTLSLINVDGRSRVYQHGNFFSDSGNDEGLQDDQQKFLAGFTSTAAAMRAAEPEVDVLGALEEAGNAAGAGRPAAGTVVLVDSGLSTTGALDFSQPGMLDAPADDLISSLRRTKALPHLSGLTVALVGVGEVARPQQKLGTRQPGLAELWTQIAKASGAACVTSVEVTRSDDPVDGQVKPVKLVPVPSPVVVHPHGIVLLDAGEVRFEEGQAAFRDRKAARTALEPIAAPLKNQPSHHLRLIGTTARWGSRDYQLDLARRRAETVKQELVGLGANPNQIETRGLGSYFAQYVPDNGPGGVLLPGPAQQNRTVRIESCDPTCPPDPAAPPA
ncbi:MAG: OmpA family protein [Pseudonocardiales bacterium]|nr:OmpA family protein [Pseudonocardiales bacterium]